MQEFTLEFNDLEIFKYLRPSIWNYINDKIPDDQTLIEVALNEAVNNALKHSQSNHPIVTLRLKVKKNKRLFIRIKDNGNGFAANDVIERIGNLDDNENLNERLMKESGRGLFIMKHVMDKVIFNQKGNEILLVKKF